MVNSGNHKGALKLYSFISMSILVARYTTDSYYNG